MKRWTPALLLVVMVLASACGGGEGEVRLPVCGEDGAATTFLMAQSTPDAALIPCVADGALPASWSTEAMEITSGGTRLALIADMTQENPRRLELRLGDRCDVSGAVSVPSDEDGTERYERVAALDNGYVGERYYVFDGGCVTYRFDAPGEGWSGFVHDASQVLSFMPRDEVTRLHHAGLGR